MYLLTEQIFNGTVTMQIVSTGVGAVSWEEAKDKVKALRNMNKAIIHKDTDTEFSYSIEGIYPCLGRMENVLLTVL